MKYLLLGLALAAALLGGVVFSSGQANAGGETRLRAFLSTLAVDPLQLSVADFSEREGPDRSHFEIDVHGVDLGLNDLGLNVELVRGEVRVKRAGSPILTVPITIFFDEFHQTGVGHLEIDSRLHPDLPNMFEGDTVEVFIPDAEGAIRAGTLSPK